MIPHWLLLDQRVSALAVRLYLVLRKHADAQGDCFPSRQRLADLLGVGIPTLDRARKQLIAVGAIEMRQRRAADDRWLTSLYRVYWEPGGGNEIIPTPRNEMIPPGNESDALTQTHLTTQDQDLLIVPAETTGTEGPRSSTGESGAELAPIPLGRRRSDPRLLYRATFEEFWRAYPRKVGKKAAAAAYEEALSSVDAESLLAAAKRYAADPNREDQFTAHPTTWLRQGRWEDEPLPARAQQKVGGQRRMDQYAEIHARIQQTKKGIQS